MTESIHDKIKKLLALAEGQANDAESNQAMEMATRLMMKHGIEADQLKTAEGQSKIVEGNDMPLDLMTKLVYAAVSELFVCKILVTKKPDGTTQARFLGRKDNVEAAELTATHILLQINQLYREKLTRGMSKGDRARFRKGFKQGAALRVHDRACEIASNMNNPSSSGPSRGTALVIHDHRNKLEEELLQHMSNKGYGRRKPRRLKMNNSAATQAGMIAGDSVEINRGVRA